MSGQNAEEGKALVSVTADHETEKEDIPRWKRRLKRVQAFVLKNFLVLGLVTFVIGGGLIPQPGQWMDNLEIGGRNPPFYIFVFTIFLISGLKLSTSEVKEGLTAWKSFLYGIISIMAITPMLTFAVTALPYPHQEEFLLGFAVFCNAPTTLTSGVILTKVANGNIALALLLTVVSNLLCVFTIPFVLPLTLANKADDLGDIDIDSTELLIQLLLVILLPLLIGKFMQQFSHRVRVFVKNHGTALKITSAMSLIFIPWMKVSDSVEQLKELDAVDLIMVVVIGAGIHAVYLVFNWTCTTAMRLPLSEKKCVVIMTSEKTLPVSIAVIGVFPEEDQGLMSIALICSHIIQIVMDGAVAGYWADKFDEDDPLKVVDDDNVAVGGGKLPDYTKLNDEPSVGDDVEKDTVQNGYIARDEYLVHAEEQEEDQEQDQEDDQEQDEEQYRQPDDLSLHTQEADMLLEEDKPLEANVLEAAQNKLDHEVV